MAPDTASGPLDHPPTLFPGMHPPDLDLSRPVDALLHEGHFLSKAYPFPSGGILVVDDPTIFSTPFSYKRYCQKQNEWMRQHRPVYRFIQGDPELDRLLGGRIREATAEYHTGRTLDREHVLPDPSPLEYRFEECFAEAFGPEALKYLKREFSFLTRSGRTAYVDYALLRKDGSWVAIEENGVSFHHPFLIKDQRYRRILQKQNSIIAANGLVFRWDTESLINREKTMDELKEFLGSLDDYLVQHSLTSKRDFALHEHEADHLADLKADRSEGKRAALVVLPTGTGKTTIALEDMKAMAEGEGPVEARGLVPSLDLVRQWQRVGAAYEDPCLKIHVTTYAGIARRYFSEDPTAYDYLVVDEAHHGQAPVLKKVIQHYQPKFLLGLTATDQRLDARSLQEIFGQYEEKLNLKEAIEQGLLAQIRAFRLESSLDLSEVRFNGQDYVAADLERRIRVSSRNELIVDVLHEDFSDRLPGNSGVIGSCRRGLQR